MHIRDRDVTIKSTRPPGRRRRQAVPTTRSELADDCTSTSIGGRHGDRHAPKSKDSEPHHRRRSQGAGSPRPPGWRGCSGSPTSGPCQRDPRNEGTTISSTTEGRRLGRMLYQGRWLDPQALTLRESIERWIASLVTGEVTPSAYGAVRTTRSSAPTARRPPTTRTSCRSSPPSMPRRSTTTGESAVVS